MIRTEGLRRPVAGVIVMVVLGVHVEIFAEHVKTVDLVKNIYLHWV